MVNAGQKFKNKRQEDYMSEYNKIGVLGGGAWGTALALTTARAGRQVSIWARNSAIVEEINSTHQNKSYLPEIKFDQPIIATSNLADLKNCDAYLLVTPAQSIGTLSNSISQNLNNDAPVIICAKGIDRESGLILTDLIGKDLPNTHLAVLSGPSFAIDVAKGLPTAVTIAANSMELSLKLASMLASPYFRPYASDDLIGVQIGGALKNVLAIACGIVQGRELGASALSALIARGFAELTRLGTALNAKPDTLMGLSGLGDLVLTCSSTQSRNFAFGIEIGRGKSVDSLISSGNKTIEGYFTASIAQTLANKYQVELPICIAVNLILNNNLTVDEAMKSLLSRPLGKEK